MSHELLAPTFDQDSESDLVERFTDRVGYIRRNLARLAVTGLAVVVGTASVFIMEEASEPSVAAAATLGYPDYDMPCEHYPYDETGACSGYDWGPAHTEAYSDPSEISSRGYAYRNCTDYVAWKEATLGVSVPHNLGDAGDWYANAPAGERSAVPQAGDVAVEPDTASNPFGHLAFVESVNADGTMTVSEYNHDLRGSGDTRTGTPASMGFTEFLDLGASTSAKAAAATTDSAPSIAYNPGNDLPVVAEQDPSDNLLYHYQKSGADWGVVRLGEADSAPSVAYNPGNDLPVVAVEGAGHTLEYYYQKTDGSWGSARLGEADSAPDVAYNPTNDLPIVAAEGAGRALVYYYQKSDGGWGHANLGETGSAPSVAYNPGNHLPVIASEDPDGTLDYHYQKTDGSWGMVRLGTADSGPDVAYNPENDLPAIAVRGDGNSLDYHYQRADGSWGAVRLGEADSAPSVAYNPTNGLPVVAVLDGGQLAYHYQKSDGSWGLANLGPADSAPGAAYNPSNGLPVIAAEAPPGGSLEYHYQKSDGGWGSAGL